MEKDEKYGWDGDVFYCGGLAYGLTPELQTICLGKAEIIEKALGDRQLPDKLNSTQRLVLLDILEDRKEQNGEDVGTGNLERRRIMRITRHNQKATRLSKANKRFSRYLISQRG